MAEEERDRHIDSGTFRHRLNPIGLLALLPISLSSRGLMMRVLTILLAVAGIGVAATVPVAALDVCTHSEEDSSFLCGEVLVELRTDAAATIDAIASLLSCPLLPMRVTA